MTEKEPTNVTKAHDAQLGESDEFILPVAPPTHTNLEGKPRTKSTSKQKSSSAIGEMNDESISVTEKTANIQITEEKNTGSLLEPVDAVTTSKSSILGFVYFFVFCVGIIMWICFNTKSSSVAIKAPSLPQSSAIDKSELVATENELANVKNDLTVAQNESIKTKKEIGDLKDEIAKMVTRNIELENLLSKKYSKENSDYSKILAEKQALESREKDLLAQVDQLKNPSPPDAPKAVPITESEQIEPVIAADKTRYRVMGLEDGDSLNVRSGPGATYLTVIRLYNEVELSITGEAVMNDKDVWLPCLVDEKSIDPFTGKMGILKRKGWVNSYFVERVTIP